MQTQFRRWRSADVQSQKSSKQVYEPLQYGSFLTRRSRVPRVGVVATAFPDVHSTPNGVARTAPGIPQHPHSLNGSSPVSSQPAAPVHGTAHAAPETQRPWYDEHRSSSSYRSVFDHAAWVEHRNPMRYFNRLLKTAGSKVLRNCMPAVSWVTFVAVCVGTYCTMLAAGMLPAWCPEFTAGPIAQAFLSTTTMAMSLLLVFRTNQSYARWDEARKFWGATLNRSRDLARQVVTLFPDRTSQEAFLRWHVAYVRSMHRHFQNEGSLEQDVKGVLNEEELRVLLNSQHRPMKALHIMGEILMRQAISPIHQYQVSLNIQHFHDQLGACERLLRTPIPVSYTRHTSRFLFLWLSVLPFSLWGTCGWMCVPLTGLIAVSLLKIDEIGMQIEEPFSILPLDVIAGRIHTDVMSTLKDAPDVKEMVSRMISPFPTMPASNTFTYAYN